MKIEILFNIGLPEEEGGMYLLYDLQDMVFMTAFLHKGQLYSANGNVLVTEPTRYIWCKKYQNITNDAIKFLSAFVSDSSYHDAKELRRNGGKWHIQSLGTKESDDYGFETKGHVTKAEAWADAALIVTGLILNK